ncbi:HupE/UreJ family protein [Tropicimonas isoalkanivorans]|uniref:HupE / UreJ protein n=1 Tax=Tropicimonas isoalkanivorans TaxID=441112 RepID=A0A1I1DF21_9RHOB|nr:HupE/UreJ family protein [Tropicimonas isoalkanivorans]SFB72982.1 HupE / UreJ protein [Tropicimonas isoalkanivorans]
MRSYRERLLIPALALLSLLVSGAAWAHFKLNLNVRVFHIVHSEAGLDVYLRTPMAYLVADKLGPIGADGLPAPAPFTTNRLENGVTMHLVDPNALRADPLGLGRISANGLRLETGAGQLAAEVVSVRVHQAGKEPAFATRAEATVALASGVGVWTDAGETYVGNAVVDVHLAYPTGAVSEYTLATLYNPGLPGVEDTANLILDYRGDATRTYRTTGLMADPVTISGSPVAAASTFVLEGVRHILEGIDHVLFVICMVIGAQTLGALLARVSGFTIGHTVTLSLGFFGIAPSAPWFIPAVETAIALSIIWAAADAALQRQGQSRSNRAAVAITASIGLLHGFGFSFMLRNILQIDSDNVWQSLLAFNLGVEFGQLAIVALIWPLVLLIRRMPTMVWIRTRGAVALSVSAVAAIWAVERASFLIG